MNNQPTEQSFLKDVAKHEMTVLRDDGVHRHVRFKQPDSGNMYFDIVTYPHFLVYSGDMGCYVFSRINDMFEFFRGENDGPLRINLSYWAEKLEATDKPDGHRQFDPDSLREYVSEWLNESEADDALRERVEDEILAHADDGEVRAYDALHEFEHEGRLPFQDCYRNFDEYTLRFTWCCYALAWAIRCYDTQKAKQIRER
jgi:hypothetical protein